MGIRLSKRLMAIAALVPEGERLVDVGCDHAYLPSFLVQEGRIPSALATDVREGPLERALAHVKAFGLEEKIKVRLSDGLLKVSPGEGDCLVLAGMGGPLMEKILREGEKTAKSFQTLIAQPQSEIEHFRRFLCEEGWEVYAEDMILEDGKYYPMMAARRGEELGKEREEREEGKEERIEVAGTKVEGKEEKREAGKEEKRERTEKEGEKDREREQEIPYTLEESFGPLLLAGKHPVLHSYLLREENLCQVILRELEKGEGEGSRVKKEEMKRRLSLVREALNLWEGAMQA